MIVAKRRTEGGVIICHRAQSEENKPCVFLSLFFAKVRACGSRAELRLQRKTKCFELIAQLFNSLAFACLIACGNQIP